MYFHSVAGSGWDLVWGKHRFGPGRREDTWPPVKNRHTMKQNYST